MLGDLGAMPAIQLQGPLVIGPTIAKFALGAALDTSLELGAGLLVHIGAGVAKHPKAIRATQEWLTAVVAGFRLKRDVLCRYNMVCEHEAVKHA